MSGANGSAVEATLLGVAATASISSMASSYETHTMPRAGGSATGSCGGGWGTVESTSTSMCDSLTGARLRTVVFARTGASDWSISQSSQGFTTAASRSSSFGGKLARKQASRSR
eukprot:CAMPEP_0195152446 /NCGR_PEP_ID=MMETSP0448-20130528/182356_1 /TAXON_ID=66468 /ORGANISM="Heterocapsa triquestra, Strain CCMP 448" /LENGTH=113 /DNA_ID=CAMNT_0040191203 /DNA_START=84 /DNA_END=422 /DNA_ORIENTATION=+